MSSASQAAQPAIFLDRDGVLLENREDYIRSWEQAELYLDAVNTLFRLTRSEYLLIVVTNQSVVGRGIIPLETAQSINHALLEVIRRAGGRIDAVYMCPHAPWEACDCRKPMPGLILQAAREHNIDLARSILIGDALTDLEAGRAAGVGRVALLRTGRGAAQLALPEAAEIQPFPVFDTLGQALAELVASSLRP